MDEIKKEKNKRDSFDKSYKLYFRDIKSKLKLLKHISKMKTSFPALASGKRVLFWSIDGHRDNSRYAELLLGIGLRLQGVDVAFVLCDGFLSACIRRRFKNDKFQVRAIETDWPKICPQCCSVGDNIFQAAGVKCYHMSDYVSIEKKVELKCLSNNIPIKDIEYYESDNIPHGNIVSGTVFRLLYGTMTISDVVNSKIPYITRMYRESFCDSLICGEAVKEIFKEFKPTNLYTQHGIYTPWGPPFHYALSQGIPVTRANRCNKYNHLIFSTSFKDKIRPTHSACDEHWENFKNVPLNQKERNIFNKYMTDMINRSCKKEKNKIQKGSLIRNKFHLSSERKIWLITPPIHWENNIGADQLLFKDSIEWMLETFGKIKDIIKHDWIIRIHPAERRLKIKNGTKEFLLSKYKYVPNHIKIIASDSKISTYSLLPAISGCISIGSTTGIETVLWGKPTFLVGEGYYGKMGFTNNFKTRNEYFETLKNTEDISPPTDEQVKSAERFMYNAWIYKQVPFNLSLDFRNFPLKDFSDLRKDKVIKMFYYHMFNGGEFGLEPNEERKKFPDWKKKLTQMWFS